MKKLLVSVIALFGAVSLSAQDVTAIYNEAAAAFGAKNFTEAATKFEQVIDQGMDNESAASMVATAKSTLPKCYFMLGGGALKTKNYDEALKNFEKSAELAELYGDMNQMAKSNGWVAKIDQIQGGDAINNKDYATASEIYAKGYAADPDNTGMALNLAMSYCEMAMSSGDMTQYEKGMEIYEAVAAKTHPKYAEDAAKAKEDMALYTNNMVPRCRLPTISTGSSRWPTTCWPRIPRAHWRRMSVCRLMPTRRTMPRLSNWDRLLPMHRPIRPTRA